MKKHSQDFKDYARRMKEIRLLSTPDLRDFPSADNYSHVLAGSSSRIGEPAEENRIFIDACIMPLIALETGIADHMRPWSEFFRLLKKNEA